MSGEFDFRAQSEWELLLSGPRDGDETEVVEKGGGNGETKRTASMLIDLGPREGDETETTERGGGAKRQISASQADPRDGDETTPIRESPLGPPVRV